MGDLADHDLWPPSINSLHYIHEEAFNFDAPAFAIRKTPSITQNPPQYNNNNYQRQYGIQQDQGTANQDNKRQNTFFSRNEQQNKQARSGQQVGFAAQPYDSRNYQQNSQDQSILRNLGQYGQSPYYQRNPAGQGPNGPPPSRTVLPPVRPATQQPLPHPTMSGQQPSFNPYPPSGNHSVHPQHGKSSATIPLLQWAGIQQGDGLPAKITAWQTLAPPGTSRTTPYISGKWLCFKFCTEGLFCRPPSGQQCMFAHVDLAQSSIWNSTSLCPVTAFLIQPGVDAIGLTLTQAGTRAAEARISI